MKSMASVLFDKNINSLLKNPLVIFYVSAHFQRLNKKSTFGKNGYSRLGISDKLAKRIWKLIN